jgi:hypothetical protein
MEKKGKGGEEREAKSPGPFGCPIPRRARVYWSRAGANDDTAPARGGRRLGVVARSGPSDPRGLERSARGRFREDLFVGPGWTRGVFLVVTAFSCRFLWEKSERASGNVRRDCDVAGRCVIASSMVLADGRRWGPRLRLRTGETERSC